MILGMSLSTFVQVHTIISLIAIVAGIIVMFGMLSSKRPGGLTAIFLLLTILLGSVFLGIKVVEYADKFHHHLVPAA